MNYLILLALSSLSIINCNAINVKDMGTKLSRLTSELRVEDVSTDEQKLVSDICSQKCVKEVAELKQNLTELYVAFLALHAEFQHLNQHMMFHEKALKHIAVWGDKHTDPHHNHNNDHNFRSDYESVSKANDSSLSEEQGLNSSRDQRTHHHHHHHHHHCPHHTPHHPHRHCQTNSNPQSHPYPGNTDIKDTQIDDKKKENSSEESSEDLKAVKPLLTEPKVFVRFSESKSNESVALNDSQTSFIPKAQKRSHSVHSIQEQMEFQSMESEFKEWFDNMLSDIHHKPDIPKEGSVDESENRSNVQKLTNEVKDQQKAIDEMEKVIDSEELVFAVCNVRPNRHIALLNQQDVEGTITLWQLKHNRGPLHMHIQIKGFKVANHEHSHNQFHQKQLGHPGHNRPVRETILIPVEAEPDEPTHSTGAPHSHGFHIHEFGNLSRGCQSVGSHYNPLNLAHGGPYDAVRHIGDLGNIRCDKSGQIDAEYTFSQASLSGIHSIINRSLVIHSNPDDYGRNPDSPSSSSTGSSGVRIACCVIEEVKTLPKEVDSQSNIGSVAGPVITSKRRRDISKPQFVNQNRFEDSKMSDILKKFVKYENELKYKTLIKFNEQQTQRLRFNEQ